MILRIVIILLQNAISWIPKMMHSGVSARHEAKFQVCRTVIVPTMPGCLRMIFRISTRRIANDANDGTRSRMITTI
jgi:hypothetical protein